MIELLDEATKWEVWAQKVETSNDVIVKAEVIDSVLSQATCLICERRWAGDMDELREFMATHEHDLVKHIDWYVNTYRGWPTEFVDLIRQLLEAYLGSDAIERQRFVDLRLKQLAGADSHVSLVSDGQSDF